MDRPFWIVGMGASAGGLEALNQFFGSVPPGLNIAYIVAQHLAPQAKSMMAELVGKHTKLTVRAAKNGGILKPGNVYIIPPNFDGVVERSRLRLTVAGSETRPKPSVDRLFESLAKAHRDRAVGIVLSGTGTDGAAGMRAIRAAGGVTLVQESKSAKYDGMPNASLDTGPVDAVDSAEELGRRLPMILGAHHERDPDANPDEGAREILELLKRETGTDFREYKVATVRRRIEKRMAIRRIHTMDEYLEILRSDSDEIGVLSREMLISVTSFFRDPDAFEALEQALETLVSQKNSGDEMRIWVAGCASGEEAYSIAMLLDTVSTRRGVPIALRMFATDLDQEALNVARSGFYSEADVSSLPEGYLERYFLKKNDRYEVIKEIRDRIVFARQDLVQSPPFVKIDLITCRNVLIYFEAPLQNRIFEIFHYSLLPTGILFLGKSENVPTSLFSVQNRKAKVFGRIGGPSKVLPPLSRYTIGAGAARRANLPNVNLAEIAAAEVFRAHDLCAFVIDAESVIRHVLGSPADFVRISAGVADFRLTNLLPKDVAVELVILIKKAAKNGELIRGRPHPLERDSSAVYSMTVAPIPSALYQHESLFIVTFERGVEKTSVVSHPEFRVDVAPEELRTRVLELEQELAATREHLQTAIEELEISNEELQSLNEELSSTNEELQASNEELETTNEELQSTNEELTTLNEEVTTKAAEVRATNIQFENVQNSIGSPMVVVDSDLRIERFNPDAEKVFRIMPSDLGRPLVQLSSQVEIPRFEERLRKTVASGIVEEVVCQNSQMIYQMRIHPCVDEHGRISGAVVVFFDNTELMRAQEKINQSDLRLRSILDGSPTIIALKDASGRYLTVNQTFLTAFGLEESDVIGRMDGEIFDAETAAKLREGDMEVILKRVSIERQDRLAIGNRERIYHCSRFPLFQGDETTAYAVGAVFLDVTDQVQSETLLRESEARYRAIIEEQAVFVCRHLPNGKLSFMNAAFCNYFGDPNNSNLGKVFSSLVDPEDRARVEGLIKELDFDSPIVQYEHRVPSKGEGPRRWIRWIHRVLFGEDRKIVEYQAVGFDVTEIHNQTVDLLQKESFFTRVIEHTSDQLTVFNVQGDSYVLESFNQSAARGRGLDQAALLGKTLEELIGTDRRDATLRRYRESVATNRVVNFEETIESSAGTRYLSTTLVPITSDTNRVERVAAVSRDITPMKRVEAALRVEKRNAEAANKAKSDFLAAMSHELRTPLNVITGMSELLARADIKPAHLRLVTSIQRSGKVLLSLIEEVLDLSKIEAGKLTLESRPFNLSQVVTEVVQSFELQAQEKAVRLDREWMGELDEIVVGDAHRFRQILMNLVGNAVKFTESGFIRVSGRSDPGRTHGWRRFRIEVQDTGVGIPQESFSKIFGQFSQADSGTTRRFGGSGLGLAISRQIVELMDGHIAFESHEGSGSKFWFEIELLQADETDGVDSGDDTSRSVQGLKVLGVDDNPESLNVLGMMLAGEGAEFRGATSGEEAIRLLEEAPSDIVLMDVQMPEMDGLETTRRIRGMPRIANLPVIALTANAMAGDAELCRQAGMDDYLTKPVDFPTLYRTVAKWAKPKKRAKKPV